MDVLTLDSTIETTGRYNGKTVREILEKNRGDIMKLIKKGFRFDEEVLAAAHIKKTERERRSYNVIVDHDKNNKTYEKDTASMKEILKQINTIDRIIDGYTENEIDEEPDVEK